MPDPILEKPGRGEAMEATLAARDLRASHQLCLATDNATNVFTATPVVSPLLLWAQ